MAARVEELPDNKVRFTVDVSEHELEHAVEHATSDLAQTVKIPGFRKGKVPTQVLVSRIGKERIYSEAVESHIEGWFRNALAESSARIRPVTRPEYEYDVPSETTEPFTFTATIGVQPPVEVAEWKGLQVGAPEADVPAEVVDQQIEALRFAVAELAPVERAAQAGDTLVVDLVAENGEAQRDYVVELGAARVLEEVEEALVGMSAGETKTVQYGDAAGNTGSVEVTLKDVKEKILPPVDDELARSASEFDTIGELRADIEQRIREQLEDEIETQFRAAAVDKLVEASNIQPSMPLVAARARELIGGFAQSLEARQISLDTYLAATNSTAEQLEQRFVGQAAMSVARELVLEAVADKAGIEVTDDEVREFIRENAQAEGEEDVEQVVEQIFENGRHELLRDDLRMRKALDLVVSEVERIPLDLEQARDKLWTPDKGAAAPEQKIWTPGSKE